MAFSCIHSNFGFRAYTPFFAFCLITNLTFCVFFYVLGQPADLSYCNVSPYTYPEELDIAPDICSNPTSPLKQSQRVGFSASLSHQVARDIGYKYAPITYFHPRENAFIDDGAKWIQKFGNNATFQVKEDQYYRWWREPMTEQLLLDSARKPNMSMSASNYFWIMDDFEDPWVWRHGADFDENQRSQGVSYFNVYDLNEEVWVFNYFFWFSFQGCSNQWAISEPRGNNRTTGVLFEVCDMGVHDGDLENLAVVVCKNTDGNAEPIIVRYMQHGLPTTYRNCSLGHCRFLVPGTEQGLENEPYHPLSYTALFTHALYDEPAVNYVYATIPIPFVKNFIGIMLVDRTYDGNNTTKRYVPTRENALFLPDIEDLNPTDYPDVFWMGYGGRHGESDGTPRGVTGIICVDNSTGLEEIECPGDQPFFNLVMNFYGFNASGRPNLGPLPGGDLLKGETAAPAPQGPYNRIFWNEWVPATNQHIYGILDKLNYTPEDIMSNLCNYLQTGNNLAPRIDFVPNNAWNFLGNIVGAAVFGIIIFLMYYVAYGWPFFLTVFQLVPVPAGEENPSLIEQKAKERIQVTLYTDLILSFLVTIGNIVGFSLFIYSIEAFFDLLEQYISITSWYTILNVIYVFSGIAFTLFLVSEIIGWYFLIILIKTNHRFEKRKDVLEMATSLSRKQMIIYRWLAATAVFMAAIYLIFYFFSFLSAVIIASVYSVFVPSCNKVGIALEGICISLAIFGGVDVLCGDQVAQFCGQWLVFKVEHTFWGAVLVFVTSIIGMSTVQAIYWHVRYVETSGPYITQSNGSKLILSASQDSTNL